jgi:tetratricopeptide (TPR) repeat protein
MPTGQTTAEISALFQQALALQNAGRLSDAQIHYEKLLVLQPQHPNALNNLGILLNGAGLHQEALDLFERQLSVAPQDPHTHANRGVALKALGRLDDATDAYNAALRCDPDFHTAHNNLGNLRYGQSNWEVALTHFEAAAKLVPDSKEYRFMVAKCLLELQAMERAEAELRLVLRQDPSDADAWGTLGRLWTERHCMPEALRCFEQGLQARPDYPGLTYNRGLARLLAGDMAGGFADYERRFDVPDFPSKRIKTTKPLWQGQPLPSQTLLVHAEQGLGDTLQFLRYIDRLSSRCLRVLLLIQESLTPLVVLPANVELVHEGSRPPAYDFVCPLLSLPHWLGLGANAPPTRPYLKQDPERSARWAPRFSAPGLRVGLVWAGNPSHKNDANRSIDLDMLLPALALDGVQFYSFQVGPRSTDVQRLPESAQAKVVDLSDDLKDFGDTAAALQHVDLLVCVDTSICHVAAAMGLPVWLMLPWMPDWRWLLEREDSPWYPSMRLLRQPRYRDWGAVVSTLAKDLKELASPQSAGGRRRSAAAHALVEQGRVMLERNEHELASPAFWRALRECPTHARAASALAIAAFRTGRTTDAVMLGQRACRLSPLDPETWSNCGAYFKAIGDVPGALRCFEQGLQARPDYPGLTYNRGLARLLAGDMAGGFADYERRFDVPDFPSKRIKTTKPLWQGQPLPSQTLLVHAEQGLGDTLQFLRYIDRLSSRCLRVLLLIQESLTPLVVLPANVELVHEGSRPPAYDFVCPLLSLPHWLGLGANAPPTRPYLKQDPERSARWAPRFSAPGLRVGLVWAGNPSHKNDANRSIDLDMLLPALALDGVQFYSFQVGPRSTDVQRLPESAQAKVVDLSDDLKDFGDTAAALQHVDLLVCVDTSICHVAAAMGLPVWLMLPWMPDWRWLLEREDSPWYPSMRLLRQPRYRDWGAVVSTLAKDLKELASPQSAGGRRRSAAAHALVEQGRVMLERNEHELASPAFWRALRECPTHARAASALAIAAFRTGRTTDAVMLGQRACRLSPLDPETWSNCGAFMKANGMLAQAAEFQLEAVRMGPDNPSAQSNLGNILGVLGEWERALQAARAAVALTPQSIDFLFNLGIALKENGLFDEALSTFRRAQSASGGNIKAELHEALLELLMGQYAKGWTHYESRWLQPDAKEKRNFSQPLWTGQDLRGQRILLHAEQGFGDTLQFLRFVPTLAQQGAHVILVVQAELHSIASRVQGVAQLVSSGAELPPFDYQCPLMSIPAGLGLELADLVPTAPYLHASADKVQEWKDQLGPRKKYRVALVWAGRPTHGNDANRSLRLGQLQALLVLPNVECISVQKGDAVAQIAQLPSAYKIRNLSPQIHSFEDTAAILTQVDELVTVDTSVAHLAGGLGVKVRVLLPLIPDWRWLLSRSDSPWYPSARLYRQTQRGAWGPVLKNLLKSVQSDATKSTKKRR